MPNNLLKGSKLRRHFTQDGKPKRRYPDLVIADEAAKKQGFGYHGYKCAFCGYWHIGH